MRFASLGSGSRGNALLVEANETRVLIDVGFGPREITRRLAALQIEPRSIAAVLVTHEHSDHLGGAFACARNFGWRVFMTAGTLVASGEGRGPCRPDLVDSHSSFELGDLQIHPFPVPHDAREPVQFIVGDGCRRLAVLTDAGHVTPHMVSMVDQCDAIVLECNHDRGMLAQGPYPERLKRRVGGPLGHLDNDAAASLLGSVDRSRLHHVIAAHLSEKNNTPDLARRALGDVLGCAPEWIGVADQATGFGWRSL